VIGAFEHDVAVEDGLHVDVHTLLAFDLGLLRTHVGFVEVLDVLHEALLLLQENDGQVLLPAPRQQQPDSTCATSGFSVFVVVGGDVAHNDYGLLFVVLVADELVYAVLQGGGASLAGVDVGDPLHVDVFAEQLHQRGLNRLAVVVQGFCPDFDPSDVELVQLESVHQVL